MIAIYVREIYLWATIYSLRARYLFKIMYFIYVLPANFFLIFYFLAMLTNKYESPYDALYLQQEHFRF